MDWEGPEVVSVKSQFDGVSIFSGDENKCVALVGHQLIAFLGLSVPDADDLYAEYCMQGRGNGFEFLERYIKRAYPRVLVTRKSHEDTGSFENFLCEAAKLILSGSPVGISPGGAGGHVAVLVEIRFAEEKLVWWEAQQGQYIKCLFGDFVPEKRPHLAHEVLALTEP